ncbi:pyrroline-5-carboxylate reductase family protein [Brevundimonas sp. R86498]|uniref:pyrroline-5-carboxylate reductase family protein n=1 Tax=Brevundimonas sp. R86498 TaxID=3093845 RepID=UPI0037C6CDC3
MAPGPVTLLGHGRLGSALVEGWRLTGTVENLTVLTRADPAVCPGGTRVLVIAVKPGAWRDAVAPLVSTLPAGAVVLSVMAGVRAAALATALPGHPIARVMPTTAVAEGRGIAAVWSEDPGARSVAHRLFDPVADTVDLADEALMDAATAVAGSAPAFFYAMAEALAEAGTAAGLPPEAAARLARGALRSAGSGADSDQSLETLISRIASPGGTTRAGLDALLDKGLDHAVRAAVEAAIDRARRLARDQPA